MKRFLFEAKLKPDTNSKVSLCHWTSVCNYYLYRGETLPFISGLPHNSVVVQELVCVLAEDNTDIHTDPILFRACALDLQLYCRDIPRGEGRRTLDLIIVTLNKIHILFISTARFFVMLSVD